MLSVTPIPAFNDNYIWALHDTLNAVLVDPGDAAPSRAFLESRGLNLSAILVTHHHRDHAGGIGELASRYRPRVFGPAREPIPGVTDPIAGGDRITIGATALVFDVIDTPGHTLGHVAYYGNGRLFSGDTLFACGCGRLFEGTPAMMMESLDRLAQLPDDTLVFCAHEYTLSNIRFARTVDGGNPSLLAREKHAQALRQKGLPTVPSSLALEKATNPFLRCREPALAHAAEVRLKRPPRDAVEVFAALRHAKDEF